MLTEIACGPISEPALVGEISFICTLFRDACPSKSGSRTGGACNADIDTLYEPNEVAAANLSGWILSSIESGIYEPGRSDLLIEDRERLKVLLCHEADIHITTNTKAIIEQCASRWLAQGYRMLRSNEVPAKLGSWREVHSVDDATAGL